MAGYSGTPLPTKLGIKAGHAIAVLHGPAKWRQLLIPLPDRVAFVEDLDAGPYDIILFFVTSRELLEAEIARLIDRIPPEGAIWVCWPKKSSGVVTDMTEDVIRAAALPRGLVDNKVCAVDAIWSALRLVIRRENRPRKKSRP